MSPFTNTTKSDPTVSSRKQKSILRVLTSFHRSGTHWLKSMISHVLGADPLEKRLLEVKDLKNALNKNAGTQLCYDHFDYELHGSVLNRNNYPALHIVVLYRHPLDALVSQFYMRAQKQALSHPDRDAISNLKLFLREDKKYGSFKKRKFMKYWPLISLREYVRCYIIDWLKQEWIFGVKYEELLSDTKGLMKKILDYYQIAFSSKQIEEAMMKYNFSTLSGGRSVGNVDISSHYRKGIPGEWKEVYDSEDLSIVRQEIGDYLDFLGYKF